MSSPSTRPLRTTSVADRQQRSDGLLVSQSASALETGTLWGLSRGDRWFLSVMLAVLAGLLTLHVRRDTVQQSAPVTVVSAAAAANYVFQLDPNSATWVEWAQLDGIGPTLARRIVEDRATHGPFQTVEDLRRVKGIGVKTLDKLRPHLVIAEADPQSSTSGGDGE